MELFMILCALVGMTGIITSSINYCEREKTNRDEGVLRHREKLVELAMKRERDVLQLGDGSDHD